MDHEFSRSWPVELSSIQLSYYRCSLFLLPCLHGAANGKAGRSEGDSPGKYHVLECNNSPYISRLFPNAILACMDIVIISPGESRDTQHVSLQEAEFTTLKVQIVHVIKVRHCSKLQIGLFRAS